MDAFFASVEQRDNPKLRGLPVIVGGDPHGRGVVSACSYQARTYGVHSAMSCARAKQLCPEAIFIHPRIARYKEVSETIMAIFQDTTPLVEPLSLDEAFLDVTINKKNNPSATLLARDLRAQILRETGLTASAGVSCNKFLAKIASDINKPNGQTVITPQEVLPFIGRLPVGKFYGVGKVTERRMHALGIKTGADLRRFERAELIRHFGKSGIFFHDIVRGIDNRPVVVERGRKSIGAETTLAKDLTDKANLYSILDSLAKRVERDLQRHETGGFTITLKVRYGDFTTITRSRTTRYPLRTGEEIFSLASSLLNSTEAGSRPIRLLGISIGKLTINHPALATPYRQQFLPFFDRRLDPPHINLRKLQGFE